MKTIATYDNNLPQFSKRKSILYRLTYISEQDKQRNETTSIQWKTLQQKHISFWDTETSLSFEIVGWKTTTAGYFTNNMQQEWMKKKPRKNNIEIEQKQCVTWFCVCICHALPHCGSIQCEPVCLCVLNCFSLFHSLCFAVCLSVIWTYLNR